ncbi:flagellar basal body-associated FliL family protein [Marinicrinis sediminis]|uniref:Flagellar protein FliL n=1 Tax=Marinicrinis sediminis TaxID=1652465 RepID=A0ABW5R6C2_9BACL
MKKLVPILIIVLVSITLIAVAAFSLYHFMLKDDSGSNGNEIAIEEPAQLTAEERKELTVEVNEIITNLSNLDYIVKLNLDLIVENEKVKEELGFLTSTVKSIIVKALADTAPDAISGSQGQDAFNARMMNEINAILQEGKLKEVQITDIIITQQ